MCAVSMVHDYGRRQPDDFWTMPNYDYFKDLVKKAEDFDKATGQPHCEDPEKTAFMKKIEERLAALEQKVKAAEKAAMEEDDMTLYGSSILNSHYTLPGGIEVQLGQIVGRAHEESGLSARDWNALEEGEREVRLMQTLVAMRREAEQRLKPE